jgi:YVTN family beta-propeller protein
MKPAAVVVANALLLASLSACHRTPAPAPLLYTSDEAGGVVVAVDPTAGNVVASIPVGKRPRGLKVSRDGKLLFVALSGSPRGGPGVDESKLPPGDRSADGVGVVDLATKTLVRTLPSGQDPETFDFSPDGKTLYVSNEETAELSVLDVATGVIRGKATVGREPEGVAVRPDGKVVFVTSEGEGEVTAVDTTTLAVLAQMKTGARPRAIVFTKDGRTAFVTDEGSGKVTVLDGLVFNTQADIPVHEDSPMPSGPRPMGAVLSPDESTLYVTCGRGGSVVGDRAQSRRDAALHGERDVGGSVDREPRDGERGQAGAHRRVAVGGRGGDVEPPLTSLRVLVQWPASGPGQLGIESIHAPTRSVPC